MSEFSNNVDAMSNDLIDPCTARQPNDCKALVNRIYATWVLHLQNYVEGKDMWMRVRVNQVDQERNMVRADFIERSSLRVEFITLTRVTDRMTILGMRDLSGVHPVDQGFEIGGLTSGARIDQVVGHGFDIVAEFRHDCVKLAAIVLLLIIMLKILIVNKWLLKLYVCKRYFRLE